MAPGFFSKLVKPSGNHSRNSSANSSPQSPTSSRHPSISMSSSQSSAKNSVEKANGNGRPPTIVVEAGYESSGSGPNVTVIPPSPSISGSSLPPPSPSPPSRELAPDDSKFEDARKRVQSLPAVSPSTPSPSAHLPDDGLPTPTPATTTFVHMPSHPTPSIMHSRSSDNLRADKDKSQQGSKSGSVRSNHPRSATVAEGTHLQTPKELRHTSSNKSLRSKLSIMLPSRDSPQSSQTSSRHDRSISAPYPPSPPAHLEGSTLVESPTGLTHEVPLPHPMSVSMTTTSFGSSLSVPDNSDAVSIKSTGSAASKKRRPWRRGSNQGTPIPPVPTSATSGPTLSSASGKSSSRKNTGLASALAASGLAMANPGMNLPQISPAPAETNATSARGRTSTEMARPRGGSMNYVGSDYSDRESFHSGHDDSVSEESDSDELDLDPEDIPVTGFAVASNKRNQDFHELFPTVPEGDYLIEDYGCALQREILIQGRLYISENHVCFHANIFGWITDVSALGGASHPHRTH
ncbi:hypothetical protein C8Q74DRAFT_487862 [Fomes fomentarius]|nr:hypothetical protein C8Q74DRAFT_487862 [Fomes fomentarius]